MSTIKIDRGFTQKIQQKGLAHSIAQAPAPKKPASKRGVQAWAVGAAVGAGAAVLAAAAGLVVVLGSAKEPPAKPVPPARAAQAPAPKPAPAADARAAVEPVEDMEVYRQYDEKQRSLPPRAPEAAKPPAPAGSMTPEQAAAVAAGRGLLAEYWDAVECVSLDDLRKQAVTRKRPPDESRVIADFELPFNRAERYVVRVTGFLTPKESGDYRFYLAADDNGELWLSPDEVLDRAKLCVKNWGAVGRRQWDKDTRKSEPVWLDKGRKYALKGLLREGERSDHLAVAWSLASQDEPRVITSEYLTPSKVVWAPPK